MIDQKFNSLPWQGICDNSVTSVDFFVAMGIWTIRTIW